VASALLEHAPQHQFKFIKLSVKSLPMSGLPHELLERFEIDAKAIQKAVESL
jgi:transketolase C-terminal domain/subunit